MPRNRSSKKKVDINYDGMHTSNRNTIGAILHVIYFNLEDGSLPFPVIPKFINNTFKMKNVFRYKLNHSYTNVLVH